MDFRRSCATVLVADDNEDVRESMAFLLSGLGFRVVSAADGREAVEKASESMPDAAVLDLCMPRLDGWGACERIRALPGGARIRIFALTGWSSDHHRERSRRAGFDAQWTKPIETAELLAGLNGASSAGPELVP